MNQELKQEFEKIDKRFDSVITFLQANMSKHGYEG